MELPVPLALADWQWRRRDRRGGWPDMKFLHWNCSKSAPRFDSALIAPPSAPSAASHLVKFSFLHSLSLSVSLGFTTVAESEALKQRPELL